MLDYTPASEKYSRAMDEYVLPLLAEHGFVSQSKGTVFKRWVGDCLHFIGMNLRGMSYTGRDAVKKQFAGQYGEVGVGASIGFRSLAEFQQRFPCFAHVKTTLPQHLGGNTGRLYEPRQYLEFQARPRISTEKLGQQLRDVIVERAFRFFDEYGSIEKVIPAIRDWHPLCNVGNWKDVLCALWMLGRHDEARAACQGQLARWRAEGRMDHYVAEAEGLMRDLERLPQER